MLKFYLLGASCLAATSWAFANYVHAKSEASYVAYETAPISAISLEKSCWGPCSTYKMTLYSDDRYEIVSYGLTRPKCGKTKGRLQDGSFGVASAAMRDSGFRSFIPGTERKIDGQTVYCNVSGHGVRTKVTEVSDGRRVSFATGNCDGRGSREKFYALLPELEAVFQVQQRVELTYEELVARSSNSVCSEPAK